MRRMTKLATPLMTSIAFLVLAGCGGSSVDSAGTTPEPPVAPEPAGAPVVTLGEVSFFEGEGHDQPGPVLHADGSVELAGRVVGSLATDGTMTNPAGEVLARLHEDGRLEFVSGAGAGPEIVIAPDGTLTVGDVTASFDETGTVVGGNEGAPPLRAEGLSPETRRAAMFVIALALFAPVQEPPPPTTGGPVPGE